MTKMVLLNSRLFVSGADLSGQGNKIEINEEAQAKMVTNWRSGGAEEVLAGLVQTDFKAGGQWEAGSAGLIDDSWWAHRRVLEPWSAGPTEASDTAVGNVMYLCGRVLRTKATFLGEVGEVAPWDMDAKSAWPLVKGQSMHPSGTARSATGTGTAVQLGAVPSGKNLYANLHVLSIAGTSTPSITVAIESDNGSGFPSAAAVGSFAAATTVDGWSLKVPGPITDDWFRVKWAITGGSPSFLFLVSMGIE